MYRLRNHCGQACRCLAAQALDAVTAPLGGPRMTRKARTPPSSWSGPRTIQRTDVLVWLVIGTAKLGVRTIGLSCCTHKKTPTTRNVAPRVPAARGSRRLSVSSVVN